MGAITVGLGDLRSRADMPQVDVVIVVGANTPPMTPGGIGNARAYDARTGALQAIVFDFDGVIVNSEPLHMRAFQEVLDCVTVQLIDPLRRLPPLHAGSHVEYQNTREQAVTKPLSVGSSPSISRSVVTAGLGGMRPRLVGRGRLPAGEVARRRSRGRGER